MSFYEEKAKVENTKQAWGKLSHHQSTVRQYLWLPLRSIWPWTPLLTARLPQSHNESNRGCLDCSSSPRGFCVLLMAAPSSSGSLAASDLEIPRGSLQIPTRVPYCLNNYCFIKPYASRRGEILLSEFRLYKEIPSCSEIMLMSFPHLLHRWRSAFCLWALHLEKWEMREHFHWELPLSQEVTAVFQNARSAQDTCFRDHNAWCNICNHSEIGLHNLFWKIPHWGQAIEKLLHNL